MKFDSDDEGEKKLNKLSKAAENKVATMKKLGKPLLIVDKGQNLVMEATEKQFIEHYVHATKSSVEIRKFVEKVNERILDLTKGVYAFIKDEMHYYTLDTNIDSAKDLFVPLIKQQEILFNHSMKTREY
jgi:hypothetical protein